MSLEHSLAHKVEDTDFGSMRNDSEYCNGTADVYTVKNDTFLVRRAYASLPTTIPHRQGAAILEDRRPCNRNAHEYRPALPAGKDVSSTEGCHLSVSCRSANRNSQFSLAHYDNRSSAFPF
ncbi:hypothetical protein BaRGS_00015763 [Batillaria attramentaria]|uniref:Uncharacterized protein n=1 Tax=Batillaria attramentaria TaxID=370345 RepID=A0ABD0L168_9CAEN